MSAAARCRETGRRGGSTPAASASGTNQVIATYTLPDLQLGAVQNAVLPGSLAIDRGFLLSGVGGDLRHAEDNDPSVFWMVTDRGQNGQIRVGTRNRRTAPVPDFNPMILQVRAQGSGLQVLQVIPIVGQSGGPVTGRSSVSGPDDTLCNFNATVALPVNPSGLDTEGLVRTHHGDFWLVEELGPSVVHVDRTGKVLKRYVPHGLSLAGADHPVVDSLPAIYGKRKSNRGFEGVGISRNNKLLYIVLQSPLYNPNKATGDASGNTRVLVFDIERERAVAE